MSNPEPERPFKLIEFVKCAKPPFGDECELYSRQAFEGTTLTGACCYCRICDRGGNYDMKTKKYMEKVYEDAE